MNNHRSLPPVLWVAGAFSILAWGFGGPARVGAAPPPMAEATTMKKATGTFEVKLVPQPPGEAGDGVGRMTIDKHFRGDLEATSQGEMLAVRTGIQDSAGYVAMEQVTGTLHGRKGSFALQHSGTMTRGVPTLSVTVVPDSGTGELAGLRGQMSIDIAEGRHSYTFEYEIVAP